MEIVRDSKFLRTSNNKKYVVQMNFIVVVFCYKRTRNSESKLKKIYNICFANKINHDYLQVSTYNPYFNFKYLLFVYIRPEGL